MNSFGIQPFYEAARKDAHPECKFMKWLSHSPKLMDFRYALDPSNAPRIRQGPVLLGEWLDSHPLEP